MKTKQLPNIDRKVYDDTDRQRLWRWLLAWESDRQAADEPLPDGPVPPCEPDTVAPAAGQIRLLQPRNAATVRYPVYCAVLAAGPDGTLLTAPFSRYQDPALPGELLLSGMPPGLSVLAVWMAGLLPAGQLAFSWAAGKLKLRDLDCALEVYQAQHHGRSLPDRLRRRVGPGLHHPQDPRLEYQRQARAEWAAALEGCSAPRACTYETPAALPRAAEPRAPYTVRPPEDPGI